MNRRPYRETQHLKEKEQALDGSRVPLGPGNLCSARAPLGDGGTGFPFVGRQLPGSRCVLDAAVAFLDLLAAAAGSGKALQPDGVSAPSTSHAVTATTTRSVEMVPKVRSRPQAGQDLKPGAALDLRRMRPSRVSFPQ